MALKAFLVFIGTILAGSVIFFSIAQRVSGGFCGSGKKPIYRGMLSSLAASAAAFGSTLLTDSLYRVFWLFFVLFLLLGGITVLATHRRYFAGHSGNIWKVMGSEILYGVSIALMSVAIFATMQHYLKDQDFMYFPVMLAALAYLLPILFYNTAVAAIAIPRPDYQAWSYPAEVIPVPDERPGEHLLVIAFHVEKQNSDLHKTEFRLKSPDDFLLGELFYHFMDDYKYKGNEPIQYLDEHGQPFRWLFRRKPKWYQRHRVLNPLKTLVENSIREDTVIICDRFQLPPAV